MFPPELAGLSDLPISGRGEEAVCHGGAAQSAQSAFGSVSFRSLFDGGL